MMLKLLLHWLIVWFIALFVIIFGVFVFIKADFIWNWSNNSADTWIMIDTDSSYLYAKVWSSVTVKKWNALVHKSSPVNWDCVNVTSQKAYTAGTRWNETAICSSDRRVIWGNCNTGLSSGSSIFRAAGITVDNWYNCTAKDWTNSFTVVAVAVCCK